MHAPTGHLYVRQAAQPPGTATLPPEQGCGLALQILATLVNCAPVARRPELTAKLPLFVKVWAPPSLQHSPARPVPSLPCPTLWDGTWHVYGSVECSSWSQADKKEQTLFIVLIVIGTQAGTACTSFAA